VLKVGGDGCWLWLDRYGKPLVNKYGRTYGRFGIGKQVYFSHRIAYELKVGPIPEGMVVDHICRNPTCVRPSHLRAITQAQNMQNTGPSKNSKTGIRGVYWHVAVGKYAADVYCNGKAHIAGYFADIRDAEAAAIALRRQLHPYSTI
jgi:hypothetical protein